MAEFGDTIDPALNRRVRDLAVAVERARPPAVVDLVPTYRSLLVLYDGRLASFDQMRDALARIEADADSSPVPPPRVVDMPTCYGGDFGPDLAFVAAHAGLTPDEVVAIHTGAEYLVYMMGFTPGFTYLGGMSPRIAAPRLDAAHADSCGLGRYCAATDRHLPRRQPRRLATHRPHARQAVQSGAHTARHRGSRRFRAIRANRPCGLR